MLHVEIVDVGNSLSNLTSWQSTTNLEHVLADIGIDRSWSLSIEESIVEVVATTDHFNVVDIVAVDGWQADTTIVHLSSEHFVSEEVVTEDTTVRVGEIVRIGSGHIWQVTKHGMH